MTSPRAWVREHVPLSEEAFLLVTHLHKRRGARRTLRDLRALSGPLKLDLGSGGRRGTDGWTTVDTVDGCDLYWDLREGIPFADSAVDAIYSSHLFEHLTFEDGQALMGESLRVLKPGGSFSIAVPDARLYIEGYLGLRDIPEHFFGWAPAYHGTTAIDAVNYVAYMAGEHQVLFDQESLVHRLRLAGFADAAPRPFDPGLDLPEREYESIYAAGTKPR